MCPAYPPTGGPATRNRAAEDRLRDQAGAAPIAQWESPARPGPRGCSWSEGRRPPAPSPDECNYDQAQVRMADADCVLMLYRDDYYDADSERPGEMDIIVRKNRQGRLGQVTTRIDSRLRYLPVERAR